MFHESLTAHASKTDDSCAYCTGYGKKSALKEMLCSKAKSQKFNAKSMISNMISKWFLKKSLKSSTISLSNFPKFFYSKKKKVRKWFLLFLPILHFTLAPKIHLQNASPPSEKRTNPSNPLNGEEEKKKKNAWTFTRWITVSSVWKCRVRDRIHEIDGPIWNHSTPRAVGCSRKTQGAKGVVGKHRDVEGRRGRRGVGSPHKTMLPHLSASSTSSPLRAAPSSP